MTLFRGHAKEACRATRVCPLCQTEPTASVLRTHVPALRGAAEKFEGAIKIMTLQKCNSLAKNVVKV